MTLYRVHCDESRTTQDRYMVFGGVISTAESGLALQRAITEFRRQHSMFAELKWTKVSDAKIPQYAAFVNTFFRLCRSQTLHFRCVVFDTYLINYRQYHRNDKELGFYKFLYQFLLHSFCPYADTPGSRLQIFLDQRKSSETLADLKRILNRGARKTHGWAEPRLVSVEPVRSHSSEILQLADVLMGAVGFHQNDRHLVAGARKAKIVLASHIARMAGLSSLKQRTPRKNKHFGIWPFQLRSE